MSRPPLLRYLRTAALGEGVTDAELARRYADDRDEAAFELLVRRHADAVWAACRRVLAGDPHRAEDAFQATFLALARRAGAVRGPCLGGWLYRVSIRAALRVRRDTPCSPLAGAGPPAPAVDPDRAELSAVVQEEVAKLAEKYRLPVVLCDLSGLTHAEAAARLGWPVGTVSGRLSLARDQLRTRLARRGVTAPAAALAVALAGAAPAPADLIPPVVLFAAGGPVPPAVSSLAEGVLSAMRWAKLKVAAVLFTAAAALAGATTAALSGPPGGGQPPAAPVRPPAGADPAWSGPAPPSAFPDVRPDRALPEATPVPVLAADPPLRKLQKARFNLLLGQLKRAREQARVGQQSASDVRTHLARLASAAADAFDRPDDVRPWVEAWVGAMKAEETLAEEKVRLGTTTEADLSAARLARVEAEIALAKLPANLKAP